MKGSLAADLDEVLKNPEYDLAERGDLLDDVLRNSNIWFNGRSDYGDLNCGHFEPSKFFRLPGIPFGDEGNGVIRLSEPQNINVYCPGDYTLMRIPEGIMVASPLERNPIYYAGMSECSAVVGRDDKSLYFAHLFFSDEEQARAVVGYMQGKGIEPIVVMSESYDPGKLANFDGYESLGLSRNRIIPFRYKFENRAFRGVSMVFATSDFVHKVTLDSCYEGNVERHYNFRDPRTLAL